MAKKQMEERCMAKCVGIISHLDNTPGHIPWLLGLLVQMRVNDTLMIMFSFVTDKTL